MQLLAISVRRVRLYVNQRMFYFWDEAAVGRPPPQFSNTQFSNTHFFHMQLLQPICEPPVGRGYAKCMFCDATAQPKLTKAVIEFPKARMRCRRSNSHLNDTHHHRTACACQEECHSWARFQTTTVEHSLNLSRTTRHSSRLTGRLADAALPAMNPLSYSTRSVVFLGGVVAWLPRRILCEISLEELKKSFQVLSKVLYQEYHRKRQ